MVSSTGELLIVYLSVRERGFKVRHACVRSLVVELEMWARCAAISLLDVKGLIERSSCSHLRQKDSMTSSRVFHPRKLWWRR